MKSVGSVTANSQKALGALAAAEGYILPAVG
jgi:hypothetical protein